MSIVDDICAWTDALAKLKMPDCSDVERELNTTLMLEEERGHWRFYESKDVPLPFTELEFKRSLNDGRATLSLEVAEGHGVQERSLQLERYGEAIDLDINPRMGPEGTVTLEYAIGAAQLAFEVSYASRLLTGVIMNWGR